MTDIAGAIRYMLAPISRRVRLMVSRAVVSLVDDSLRCQGLQVQLLADEVASDVEHFQPYGLSARPLVGSEGVFLSVGGDRSHGIVVCVTDRRYRPTNLAEGETCLYTDEGTQVHCKHGGDVLVGSGATELVAVASKVLLELQNLTTKFNAHTHAYTGTVVGGGGGTAAGTTAVTTGTADAPASVAATKVKVL